MKDKIKYLSVLASSIWINLLCCMPVSASVSIEIGNPDVVKPATVQDFWNTLMDSGRYLVTGIMGILAILCVGLFSVSCVKLAGASNSPAKRSEAVKGILYSLIGIALFGATATITGLAFGLFR